MTVRGFRVLGAAAVSPIGRDLQETASSLRLGVQRHRDTEIVGASGVRVRAGCVFPVGPGLGGAARQIALLEAPLASVREHLTGNAHVVVCGSAWPELDRRMAWSSGFMAEYDTFRRTHHALESDIHAKLERSGAHVESSRVILGGNTTVLSTLGDSTLEGRIVLFASATMVDPIGLQLLSAAMVGGNLPAKFVPGEAGVVLVLESAAVADASLLVGPAVRAERHDAVGAAVNQLFDGLPAPPEAIGSVWSDASGERWRAKALAFAGMRSWGRLGMTPEQMDVPRGVGELGPASGALQVALAWFARTEQSLVITQSRNGDAVAALVRGSTR